MREKWKRLPTWAQWTIGVFVGLLVVGALVPAEDKRDDAEPAAQARQSATVTQASAPSETTTPEPTPEPAVDVTVDGPDTAHRSDVTLRGTVTPVSSKVRVDGRRAQNSGGRWSIPVTLKKGANSFDIVATRKGYVKATATADVDREPSAAERAAYQREQKRRRAARRALESAENYLQMSGFSKKGLFQQLSSDAGEGFPAEQAQYAVDHVKVDWKQEAVQSARNYLEMSPMSQQALLEQLTSDAGEGFTYEEAQYAVEKVY